MSVILREAHTIEALTSDLLALARQEAGIGRPAAPVDVDEAASNAVERLATLAQLRQIAVHYRSAGHAIILGDRNAICRIPLSLLHNALRFSDEGSRIDVEVSVEGGMVRLLVEDQGPGFTSEGLERAFERFWRGETARQTSGSGLGLAIVHSLVASANGTIEIVNRTPRGCRVIVDFPALRLVA